MYEVDARGLSCPQPVLLFHQAAKEQSGHDLVVLVDNEASRENVSRAARKLGFTVNVVEVEDGVVRLEMHK